MLLIEPHGGLIDQHLPRIRLENSIFLQRAMYVKNDKGTPKQISGFKSNLLIKKKFLPLLKVGSKWVL
jgi:hypothetical protein